jgi:hypothetical protein
MKVMKIEITLYREDLIDKTLDISDINSSTFILSFNEWLKADKISFVDDDGRCQVLKER